MPDLTTSIMSQDENRYWFRNKPDGKYHALNGRYWSVCDTDYAKKDAEIVIEPDETNLCEFCVRKLVQLTTNSN